MPITSHSIILTLYAFCLVGYVVV